jgi:3',5'-cyclic AMP phosphodiesterase CpdA
MRTLAHISDLHFGTVKPVLAKGLRASLMARQPDLIVVSGDLTQRALIKEFEQAGRYLAALPFPILVVPGNHDIPAYNLLARVATPFHRYQKHITPDLSPTFHDLELAVLGINTARVLTWWGNGRVSQDQMKDIRTQLCAVPEQRTKILVSHHPFFPHPIRRKKRVVGRAHRTLQTIDHCGLNMLLAGHFHMSYAGASHSVYTLLEQSILVIQAGTALSRRTRKEQNAYNLIDIGEHQVWLTVYMWNGQEFKPIREAAYTYIRDHWQEGNIG